MIILKCDTYHWPKNTAAFIQLIANTIIGVNKKLQLEIKVKLKK